MLEAITDNPDKPDIIAAPAPNPQVLDVDPAHIKQLTNPPGIFVQRVGGLRASGSESQGVLSRRQEQHWPRLLHLKPADGYKQFWKQNKYLNTIKTPYIVQISGWKLE